MQRDNIHLLNQTVPVIAYPIISPSSKENSMEDNVYSSTIGDSNFADDTIEMSGNFFSQLDSMIAAVKVESSALDSMKEKLREVDALRNQISTFTKRLLDADQANLNLKTNLVKVQEAYTELKKSKAEVESSMVPLRQELNRTKEVYAKERMARLSAQQETAMLKDQIMRLEKINENIDRECKTIPALADSNEILKNDLATLRKRFKDEKAAMSKQIKLMETQARDVEAVKADVRALSLRLLDIASSGSQPGGVGQLVQSNNTSSSYNGNGASSSGANYSSNMVAMNMMQQQRMASEQQLQQKLRYDNASSSNVQYEYGFEGARGSGGGGGADDEYEDYGLEDGDDTGTASRGDDAASYDGDSFIDDGSHVMLAASVESLGSSSQVHVSPPRNINKNLHQQQQQNQNVGGRGAVKKKVKRNAVGSNGSGGRSGAQPNMMQQMPNDNGNIYSSSGNVVSQHHQYRSNSGNNGQHEGGGGGMVQSFSLPRIH